MGIVKGVVLTVSAATLVAGSASACSTWYYDPQEFGITNVMEGKDKYGTDIFTGRLGDCDVKGFLMHDKDRYSVDVMLNDSVVVQSVMLASSNRLTDDPAVKQSCGV